MEFNTTFLPNFTESSNVTVDTSSSSTDVARLLNVIIRPILVIVGTLGKHNQLLKTSEAPLVASFEGIRPHQTPPIEVP